MGSSIWTFISSVIGNVLNGLSALFGFLQLKRKRSEDQDSQEHASTPKRSYDKIIMIVVIILLFGFLIWQLVSNKKTYKETVSEEPLLVFAGGGSVRNYLMELDPKILDIKNSINIAMASGSAWRVLPEEYHCHYSKQESDSSNKFAAICLSAEKIETSGNFYREYIPYLKNAIVAEVYLGDDPLVAYISKSAKDNLKIKDVDSIILDTLAQNLQKIVESKKNILIYTTNKTSGTLEQYKKSFQELKYKKSFHSQDSKMLQDSIKELQLDSLKDTILIKRIQKSIKTRSIVDLEKMMDDELAFTFYDMTPSNCIYSCYHPEESPKTSTNYYNDQFIILGSKYYYVKEFDKDKNKNKKITELYIVNDERKPITKPMYLYFLAKIDPKDPNEKLFTVDHRIIEFLKRLENKIKTPKQDVWNRIMKDGIIEYDNSEYEGKKIVPLNK